MEMRIYYGVPNKKRSKWDNPFVWTSYKITSSRNFCRGYNLPAKYIVPLVEKAELDRYFDDIMLLSEALDKIASWGEGPEVTTSFDEPNSAKIAREALEKFRAEDEA